MRALIFDGSWSGDGFIEALRAITEEQFKEAGWEVETITLRERDISHCTGCFKCWTKTPGVCVIDDEGREVTRKLVRSDVLVILTPVTFGGFSSAVKKALDRSLGIMLPYFTKIKGHVHHKPRYEHYPDLLAIGSVPERDEELERTFKDLVDRNSTNAHSPKHLASVIVEGTESEAIQAEVAGLLRSLGVVG